MTGRFADTELRRGEVAAVECGFGAALVMAGLLDARVVDEPTAEAGAVDAVVELASPVIDRDGPGRRVDVDVQAADNATEQTHAIAKAPARAGRIMTPHLRRGTGRAPPCPARAPGVRAGHPDRVHVSLAARKARARAWRNHVSTGELATRPATN